MSNNTFMIRVDLPNVGLRYVSDKHDSWYTKIPQDVKMWKTRGGAERWLAARPNITTGEVLETSGGHVPSIELLEAARSAQVQVMLTLSRRLVARIDGGKWMTYSGPRELAEAIGERTVWYDETCGNWEDSIERQREKLRTTPCERCQALGPKEGGREVRSRSVSVNVVGQGRCEVPMDLCASCYKLASETSPIFDLETFMGSAWRS
jgi:hypothetical protein